MDTYIITYRFLNDPSIRSKEEYKKICGAFQDFLDKHHAIDDGTTYTAYLKYDDDIKDLCLEIYKLFLEKGVSNICCKDDVINLIHVKNGKIVHIYRWRQMYGAVNHPKIDSLLPLVS